MKRPLVILLVLLILLGVPYGLAKIGVIPVAKMAAKNPALAKFARAVGLMPRSRTVKASTRQDATSPAKPAEPSPNISRSAPPVQASPPPVSLGETKRQAEQSEESLPFTPSAVGQVGWVAKVYENMEPEQAVRILERMNDREVIALLRRMKQRQVAQILALMPPDRAARLSKTLMVQQ